MVYGYTICSIIFLIAPEPLPVAKLGVKTPQHCTEKEIIFKSTSCMLSHHSLDSLDVVVSLLNLAPLGFVDSITLTLVQYFLWLHGVSNWISGFVLVFLFSKPLLFYAHHLTFDWLTMFSDCLHCTTALNVIEIAVHAV